MGLAKVSGTDLRKRLVAILAADAAGYSRLMAANESATVAVLDAARAVFRTQIEANQGRVIDMAGDSVLAVFETASGAVSAALAIQDELAAASKDVPNQRYMQFRIGVHLGDIIEKADSTVYGDGVNIAARLEGLAEPGRSDGEEYRRSGASLPHAARKRDAREVGFSGRRYPPLATRQTFDRGSAIRQHERRLAAGLFLRRDHRGHHY